MSPHETEIVLHPHNLRWIRGGADDPADLCAHGEVEFRIGDDELLGRTDGEITVSAAALYLLRTLSTEHLAAAPVGDHLFPCCGFTLIGPPGQDDVLIVGCPNGRDFQVRHPDASRIVVTDINTERTWTLTFERWRSAVFEFADRVASLYAAGTPRQPTDEDEDGFRLFLAEWQRRRGRALYERPAS